MFTGSFSNTLHVLTPPPSSARMLSWTALLVPYSITSLLILYCLSTWTGVHLPSCALCIVALGLLPRYLSSPTAPRREPVSIASSPVCLPPLLRHQRRQHPLQPLWVLSSRFRLPPTCPWTTTPPTVGLNLRPSPFRSWGGSCIQSLAYCPPMSFFLLNRSFAAPYLSVFWWFVFFWAPFCALARGQGVSTP